MEKDQCAVFNSLFILSLCFTTNGQKEPRYMYLLWLSFNKQTDKQSNVVGYYSLIKAFFQAGFSLLQPFQFPFLFQKYILKYKFVKLFLTYYLSSGFQLHVCSFTYWELITYPRLHISLTIDSLWPNRLLDLQ